MTLRLIGAVAYFVAVMHKGTVVEQGSRSTVLGSPSHSITIQLMNFLREMETGFRQALAGVIEMKYVERRLCYMHSCW